MPVIENVVFCYTKIQSPDFKYQSNDKEYSVDCVVSKQTAKDWNKKYPKQKAKEIDNTEFQSTFKIDPPFEADEQFVIKLKKPAQYKDGTPVPDDYKPRVFTKGSDGKMIDVTASVLVANGSKGVVQFDETQNDFGTFAKLKAIRVDELIEYNTKGSGFSELGDVSELADLSGVPSREMTDKQKSDVVVKKESATETSFDELDEDIPF